MHCWGVYLPGGCTRPGRGCTCQGEGVYLLPRYSPLMNRMTDRCENITLPKLRLREVNIIQKFGLSFKHNVRLTFHPRGRDFLVNDTFRDIGAIFVKTATKKFLDKISLLNNKYKFDKSCHYLQFYYGCLQISLILHLFSKCSNCEYYSFCILRQLLGICLSH